MDVPLQALAGEPYDLELAEVFSLGVLLFTMLTGRTLRDKEHGEDGA